MFDYKIIFASIWALLFIISSFLYISWILKWETKPHTFSFLIWSILSCIWFLGQIFDNAWIWSIVSLVWFLNALIVFILSLKYWVKVLTKWDKISFFFAFFAIILWGITKTPLYSIILVTIIDTCWYYPTLSKISRMPYSENIPTWAVSILAIIFWIIALDHYSIITTLYPAMIVFMNSWVVGFIWYFRRNSKSKWLYK